MKRAIYAVCTFLLCSIYSVGGVYAQPTTQIVDNDPSVIGNSAYTDQVNGSDVFVYYSAGGNWSGDCRRQDNYAYSSADYWYHWHLGGSYAYTQVTFEAYLANASFTNTDARYMANNSDIGYLNQDTAPNGWNTIETIYDSGTNGYDFQVSSRDYSGHNSNTGADAMEIYYVN